MSGFVHPAHAAVEIALRAMDAALLLRCRAWFGGGTALVLDFDEYRLSRDIDFLCADQDGYRALREAAMARGVAGLFGPAVTQARDVRADQYGIRGFVVAGGMPLRFEIVREARITLDGALHPRFGVPCLSHADAVAEKLLANADRAMDPATSLRDAIDLGMLAACRGPFPPEAVAKAEQAYGADVARKAAWAAGQLAQPERRAACRHALSMADDAIRMSAGALAAECGRVWPGVAPSP